MTNIRKNVFFAVLIVISTYIYYNYKYVQFLPVKFEDGYFISNEIPSNKFYINLENVLIINKESYKKKEGIIYVRNRLFNDQEISFNYTKKAQDSTWFLHQKVFYHSPYVK